MNGFHARLLPNHVPQISVQAALDLMLGGQGITPQAQQDINWFLQYPARPGPLSNGHNPPAPDLFTEETAVAHISKAYDTFLRTPPGGIPNWGLIVDELEMGF